MGFIIWHVSCAPPSCTWGERERAEADRIWEARAPETCQIRSVAAIPRTAATGSGVSQLPWPPPRLSSPPPRRFARLSSSAAITLQGERHARQVRGSPMAARRSASDRTTARARSFPVARVTTAADLREHLGKEAGGIRRRGGVELQLGFRVPCIYLVQP